MPSRIQGKTRKVSIKFKSLNNAGFDTGHFKRPLNVQRKQLYEDDEQKIIHRKT